MKLTVTRDDLSRFTAQLRGVVARPRGLVAALVATLNTVVRDHFKTRDAEPNKNNWPKQHFWDQLRGATAPGPIADTSGEVIVADYRLAQKIHGGQIVPKNKKRLAFPVHRLAYGLRAGSDNANGLSSFTAVTGIKLKQQGNALTGMFGGERITFYRLARRVNQAADPRALPEVATVETAFTQATTDYLEQQVA